jgi:hypothetical protein
MDDTERSETSTAQDSDVPAQEPDQTVDSRIESEGEWDWIAHTRPRRAPIPWGETQQKRLRHNPRLHTLLNRFTSFLEQHNILFTQYRTTRRLTLGHTLGRGGDWRNRQVGLKLQADSLDIYTIRGGGTCKHMIVRADTDFQAAMDWMRASY